MTFDADFESYSDGAGAHQQGLESRHFPKIGAVSDLPERLASRIVPEPMSGCWLWTGASNAGYGRTYVPNKDKPGRRLLPAHRVIWEILVGPIADGLEMDHLCRNHSCVSPWHLETVSHKENVRRGNGGWNWAAKTHCPQGHPYDEANTYVDVYGRRRCRMCIGVYRRRRAARVRAAQA